MFTVKIFLNGCKYGWFTSKCSLHFTHIDSLPVILPFSPFSCKMLSKKTKWNLWQDFKEIAALPPGMICYCSSCEKVEVSISTEVNIKFMEVIRTYGNIIKKYAPDHPLAAFRMIKAGLALEQFRSKHLADKRMPGAYQYLNTYAVGEVLAALKLPGDLRLGKYFCSGGTATVLWLCTVCPLNVCPLFLSGFHHP